MRLPSLLLSVLAVQQVACWPDFDGLSGGEVEMSGTSGQSGAGNGSSGQGGAGQGGTAGNGAGGNEAGASGEGGTGANSVGAGEIWNAGKQDDQGNIDAIGATETEVYWVWQTKLYRAPVAGGEAKELTQGIDNPSEMIADQGHLFLAEAGRISACTLPDCQDMAVLVAGVKPRGFTLDDASMYWVDEGTDPQFTDGTVQRCARFGCASPEILTPQKNEYHPGAIAAGGGAVYWLNRADLTAANGQLKRLDTATSGAQSEVLAELLKAPSRLAFHEGQLIWVEEASSAPLRTCQASSCTPGSLLQKPSPYPVQGVAVIRSDTSGVYWINDTGSAISSTAMRCPLPGCTEAPVVLKDKLHHPKALAQNSAYVFLGDATAGGTVFRWKKP